MDKQLTKDRTYYRTMSNAELIAVVREATKPTELELVLAERLKRAEREIGDYDYD